MESFGRNSSIINRKPDSGNSGKLNRLYVMLIVAFVVLIIGMISLLLYELQFTVLPDAVGKDPAMLQSELGEMKVNCVIVNEREFSELVERGSVSRIDPVSGEKVKKGTTVNIYISKGAPITVPDCVGNYVEMAKKSIESKNLVFDSVEIYSDDVPKNTVISMEPSAGTVVEIETPITLCISLGSEYRELPDYTEMGKEEILNECQKRDIRYVSKDEFNDDIPRGRVISCNFNPGDSLSIEKDAADFVFSKGKAIAVPALVGKSLDSIAKTLEQKGLTYSTKEEYSDSKKGDIISADHNEGDLVEEGTEISLVVSKGTIEQEFKEECETVSYDELIRNPETYKTVKIKAHVTISKVENETILGFKYGETLWAKYQGQEIVLTDNRANKEPKFRDGDTVTIYGYGNGTSTVQIKQKTYQGGVLVGFTYNKIVDSYDIPDLKIEYADFK